MLLSIIIPAFNEEALIGKNIDLIHKALDGSKFRNDNWEIIVCNNNSSDDTEKIAKASGARVVFEEHNQISRARNTGANSASGVWLLFIDADSYPSTELMNDVHDLVSSGLYVGAGSTMKFPRESERKTKLVLFLVNAWMRLKNFAAGAFFLCRADEFVATGGFSENLYIAEELDLTNKLKRAKGTNSKPFKVLHNHPFITSSRKFELYSFADRFDFYQSLVFGGKASFKDRTKLSMWYDGKR